MTIEKNMARNLPSYIIAQDVKSGYNNVNIKNLLKKFKTTLNEHNIAELKYLGDINKGALAEQGEEQADDHGISAE